MLSDGRNDVIVRASVQIPIKKAKKVDVNLECIVDNYSYYSTREAIYS